MIASLITDSFNQVYTAQGGDRIRVVGVGVRRANHYTTELVLNIGICGGYNIVQSRMVTSLCMSIQVTILLMNGVEVERNR